MYPTAALFRGRLPLADGQKITNETKSVSLTGSDGVVSKVEINSSNFETIVRGWSNAKSTESYTEILKDNGIKSRESVWIEGGDDKGDTKIESWTDFLQGGGDYGQEVHFGIGMSGSGDGAVGQDWSKNVIGGVSFDDLKSMLKPSVFAKGYKHGANSWQKITKDKYKNWVEWIDNRLKQGEQITETVQEVKKLFKSTGDTTQCSGGCGKLKVGGGCGIDPPKGKKVTDYPTTTN